MKGLLTFDEDLILGQSKPKPSPGDPVEVLKKRTMSRKQEWLYTNKVSIAMLNERKATLTTKFSFRKNDGQVTQLL